MWKRIQAILRFRCSHCLKGKVFDRPFRMNEDCPVCEIHFEREVGYWSMSIFMGYVIYFILLLPILAVLYFLGVPLVPFMIFTGAALILLMPLVFHYGRVSWLHVDEMMDPRPEPPYIE